MAAKIIILTKEDINNSLHPNMWESLMGDLNLPCDTDSVTLSVVVTAADNGKHYITRKKL